MAQHIIIICIISILLWYYYIKSKEQDDKYIPVMVRHSELMQENSVLKQENKKLRMKLKYLENYKQDVSKTFKILDNELGLINEHIKKKSDEIPTQEEQPPQMSQPQTTFETSLNPNILNSLIRESQEPDTINSIFNRFLTGDVNFMNSLSSQEVSDEREPQNQEPSLNQTEPESDGERRLPADVHFSVNYLPLNSSYRQFLIRRPQSQTELSVIPPPPPPPST